MDPRIPGTGSGATPPAPPTPPIVPVETPQVTGLNRQVSETEAHERQLENRPENLSHPLPRSEPFEEKDVAEVAPQTWLDYVKSKIGWGSVTATKPETQLPSPPESPPLPTERAQDLGSRNVGTFGGIINAVGSVLSKSASAIGTILNKGGSMIDSAIENTVSTGARSLISSKAGVDFDLNNEDWKSVLELVIHSVAGSNEVPDYQECFIPKLTKKNKTGLPLTVRNISLNARPTPIDLPSVTAKDQQTIRSIDIRQLECDVELPRPGKPPMLFHVSLLNGKATVGTDLVKTLTTAKASELENIIDKGGKNTVLPEDSTAIQVTAEELAINYDQIGARVRLSNDQPAGKDTACLTGFHNGKVTFHDVRFGRPVNILRSSPDQSTFAGFSGFSLENSADLPALVDVESVDLKDLDQEHNGSFSCKMKLHLDKLQLHPVFKFLVRVLTGDRWEMARILTGRSHRLDVDIEIDTPVRKGELTVADLKKGLIAKTSSRFLRRALKMILNMPDTKLVCSPAGKAELQVSIPTDILRYFPFIRRLAVWHRIPFLNRASTFQLKIPLPLKGIFATKAEGKIVLSELIGGIGEKFNGTAVMPGALHWTPSKLEDMALAAGEDSLSQSLALLEQARELLTEGHFNEAARALKAIPSARYAELIKQSGSELLVFIHEAAHILAPMDSRKACQIYIELLRARDPNCEVGEASDPRWLVSMAEHIKPDTKENRALLCDVLEMACKLDPHSGALTQLAKLTPDHYPATSLASLIGKLMQAGHFTDPLILTSTIEILEPRLGKAIIPLLEEYPTAPLIDLVKAQSLVARTRLNSLIQRFERHGLSSMAADIYLELNEPGKARVVLERAIDKSDCTAFARKVRSDLDQASFDRSVAEEVARKLLLVLTGKKHSEEMHKTAQGLLVELWDKAHAMGIGKALLLKPEASADTSSVTEMITRLYTITNEEYEDLSALDSILDSMKEQLDSAEANEATTPEEKTLIPIFRQLLNEIEERNNDLLFQDAEDLTADEDEPSLESVNEMPVELPPSTFMEFIPDTKAYVPGSMPRESSPSGMSPSAFELTEFEQSLFGSPSGQLPAADINTSQTGSSEPIDEEITAIRQEQLVSNHAPCFPSQSFLQLIQL